MERCAGMEAAVEAAVADGVEVEYIGSTYFDSVTSSTVGINDIETFIAENALSSPGARSARCAVCAVRVARCAVRGALSARSALCAVRGARCAARSACFVLTKSNFQPPSPTRLRLERHWSAGHGVF